MTLAITVNPKRQPPPTAEESRVQQAYKDAEPASPTLGDDTPSGVATLVVSGKRFEFWTSLAVTDVYRQTPRVFVASLAEIGGPTSWANLKIKPGDRAVLYLGGQKVCDGYILKRRTVLGDNGHEVIVEGASKDVDLSTSNRSVQFRGYTVEAIANRLIQDAGVPVRFRMENPPPSASQPIVNFGANHGRSVIKEITRICTMMNIPIRTDPDGNIVGGRPKAGAAAVADLVEGQNILSIAVTLDDEKVMSTLYVDGQHQGSDNSFGKATAEVRASAFSGGLARPWMRAIGWNGATGYQNVLQNTADFMMADSLYTAVDAQVVVRGWHRPDGQLWQVTDKINVESPTCFPENGGRMTLGLKSVIFQLSNGGSTTTLGLCLQSALGGQLDPNVKGEVPNLLTPQPETAKTVTPT